MSGSAGSNVGGAGMSGGAGAASGGTPGAGAGGMGGSAGSSAGGMSGSTGMAGGAGSGGSGGGGTFTVTNPDFMNVTGCSETMQSVCDKFPPELASYMSGPNISPELDWTGVPAGTQSFAVLLQDLVNGQAHWVIWNIPGTATMLAADVPKTSNMPATPAGSQQANASFASGDGYFGPGSACNVYEYMVFALAMPTFTPTSSMDANAVRTALMALDDSQLLGTASIRGRQAACSNNQMCNSNNMCAN
jgi:Raf kinase inhibitor-like YbhB/YbcL family protein